MHQVPYCGSPPFPGELLSRFNLDPVLIAALSLLCAWQVIRQGRAHAAAGWLIAGIAFLSPLCALSVSLFSARVAQHMLLVLVAAPLIARSLPRACVWTAPMRIWMSAAMFFICLWFWHMPAPYEATFTSTGVYWAMHITLFGSGILLWRELLDHAPQHTAQALAAGMLTFTHMGLLGAVLALADRPMFQWHLLTTQAWGLTPLQDQQFGGTVMWVPGVALFLWSTLRSIARLWDLMERAGPA
jgi:putative membrane protein